MAERSVLGGVTIIRCICVKNTLLYLKDLWVTPRSEPTCDAIKSYLHPLYLHGLEILQPVSTD